VANKLPSLTKQVFNANVANRQTSLTHKGRKNKY